MKVNARPERGLLKAISVLKEQLKRLDAHERELFNRCVEFLERGDELSQVKAMLYAEECAEVRKILKTVLMVEYALRRVLLRLEAVEEPVDLMIQGAVAVQVLSVLRKRLGGMLPEVGYELDKAAEMLGRLVTEIAESKGLMVPFESKEVEKILRWSEAEAEQDLSGRPEIPKPKKTSVGV